jgi:hypothetical protein
MNPQCLLVRSAQQKEDASFLWVYEKMLWMSSSTHSYGYCGVSYWIVATGIAEYLNCIMDLFAYSIPQYAFIIVELFFIGWVVALLYVHYRNCMQLNSENKAAVFIVFSFKRYLLYSQEVFLFPVRDLEIMYWMEMMYLLYLKMSCLCPVKKSLYCSSLFS